MTEEKMQKMERKIEMFRPALLPNARLICSRALAIAFVAAGFMRRRLFCGDNFGRLYALDLCLSRALARVQARNRIHTMSKILTVSLKIQNATARVYVRKGVFRGEAGIVRGILDIKGAAISARPQPDVDCVGPVPLSSGIRSYLTSGGSFHWAPVTPSRSIPAQK